MKQKLLSLIALAGAMFMSTSAYAQWTEPTAPVLDETNVSTVESGKSYYIKNVGAGQFITGSNSWSTQISLTRAGISDTYSPALLIYVADSTATIASTQVKGVSMRLDGTFTVNGASGKRSFTNTYLFRDDEAQGFMDHGSQDKGYIWKISKTDNGYYRIQTADGDPAYPDAATQFAGWDSTNGPIVVDEEGNLIADPETGLEPSTVVKFNCEDEDPTYSIDWIFIDPTTYVIQLEGYEARKGLYDVLMSTKELSYSVDTNAATQVYNNPSATKAELEAATAALQAAINRAYFESILGGASEDEPIEATEYVLQNPDFSTGDISGWTTNYVSGQQANNIGYQSNQSYTNGDVTISQFIEAWKSDGNPWTIGDGYLQQTVYGLPAGKYVLEADAVSTYQWADHSGEGGIGKNPAEGVFLFIQAGQYEATTTLATGNGQPEHFSVTYIHDGSDVLTFGLKTVSATANWIAADNFKITFYGKTELTPSQANLQEAIKKAEAIDTDVPANANELTAFEKAIEDAQKVLDDKGDDNACGLAADNLSAAQAAFEASVKAYADFDNYFINDNGELANIIDEIIKNDTWGDLVDQLEDLKDDLVGKFDARTLTTEEATAAEGQVHDLIFAFIQGDKIQKGDNLTFLLENPGFDNGLKGWTLGRGDAWTVFEGVDYHEVESWHQNFDLYQVIPNMPVGIYEISVQGFARLDDGLEEPTIELYAGNSTVRFPSISIVAGEGPDEYSLEKLYDAESFGDTELTMYDGTTVYVPNGMAGAVVYFATENPLTGQPFYQRTVKINLQEAGDLRIGVRSNSTHEWVLWDNIKITYAGNDISGYYSMIEDEQLKMQRAYEAEGAFITKASEDKYNALNARCAKMEELTTGDEALALMKEIQEATEYIKGGAKKGRELEDCISLYTDLSNNVPSGDTAFPNVLSAANEKYENPGKIESNEAVDDIIAGIKKAWPAYVLFDAGEEPTKKFDASHIIYNRDYQNYNLQEGYSAAGWTIENIGGNNYAVDFSEMECYNNDTINVYQAIEGLKPGFYEITVQGYYRAGFPGDYNDSIASVQNARLEATTAIGTIAAPIMNAAADAQEIQIGFGSESEIKVTIEEEPLTFYIPNNMEAAQSYFEQGLYNNSLKVQVGEDGKMTISVKKTAHIEGDWTIFTNWGLYYLGKTGKNFEDELDAVESLVDANAKATQFFSLDGRQMSRLSRGMNIVRMSDGTYRKVMVK